MNSASHTYIDIQILPTYAQLTCSHTAIYRHFTTVNHGSSVKPLDGLSVYWNHSSSMPCLKTYTNYPVTNRLLTKCPYLVLWFHHCINSTAYIHTHTHTILMAIFPGKPRLAGCSLDSQFPVMLIPSILMGQAEPQFIPIRYFGLH